MNAPKTVSFTHLASYRGFGDKLSLKDRLLSLFQPKKDQLDRYMHAIGGMMAVTYPYINGRAGNAQSGGNVPYSGMPIGIAEIKLDFAAIAKARVEAGQAALAATDILQLLNAPKGMWAAAAIVEVTKVEGAAGTMDVGDGVTPGGFIAAANLNALGFTSSLGTAAAYSIAVGGGKLYTADDTIDAVLNTAAIDVAVARLATVFVDLRASK